MDLKTFLEHFDTIAEAPGGIPKLRSLILDLAVRGKLVLQNPEDEPAELLRNKIVVEKQKLEKLKKIAKQRSLTPVQEDEQPYVLPSNWCWCRWNDVALHIGDIDHKMPTEVSEGIPYVSPRDFKEENTIDFEGSKKISYEDFERLKRKVQPTKGDIIFPRYGTIGENRFVEVDIDFLASYSCAVIKNFHRYIEPKYSYYYSISKLVKSEIDRYTNKTTQANVGIQSIQNFIYPLPPLAEQKRIVEKVDELMGLCDRLSSAKQTRDNLRQKLRESAIASLMNAETDQELEKGWAIVRDNWCEVSQCPEDVSGLRKSVLELAVRGKLVPQDLSEGEVTELIEVMLSKASFVGNRKNSPLGSGLWEIPGNWSWLPLSQFGQILGGGTPSKDNPDFWSGDIPWVSPKDMKLDYIESSQDYISAKGLSNSSAKLVPESSILMVIRGMILAHSFPVAVTGKQVTINQDMKALMLFLPEMSDYLLICLKGLKRVFLNLVERSSHGTCRLPTEELFSQPIPLPPLAEQKRIVAKVDELMKLCDQLEASLRQSQQQAESLAASAISHLTL